MITRLLTFPAWFSFSLTFSCDGHHLYTANSEGTVIAWCRRDQQRMKLPMFYSFLSSYAAGWLPRRRGLVTRTERTLWATPLTQERGGASMHKAPPMTITVSAPWYVTGTHGTVCCATSYCHWRADLGGREAERTQAFPPPVISFRYLCLFCVSFDWFVWFWKLLQSGPPRPNVWRPVSLSFITSLVSPTPPLSWE